MTSHLVIFRAFFFVLMTLNLNKKSCKSSNKKILVLVELTILFFQQFRKTSRGPCVMAFRCLLGAPHSGFCFRPGESITLLRL